MRRTPNSECLDLGLFVLVPASTAASQAFFQTLQRVPIPLFSFSSPVPCELLYKRPPSFFAFFIISHIIAPPNLCWGVKRMKDQPCHHQPPSICEVFFSQGIRRWKTCLPENKSHPFQAAFPLACLRNIILGASLAKASSAGFHELT